MVLDTSPRIALVGACGRMGRALTVRLLDAHFSLLPIEAPSHPTQGKDYGIACGMAPAGVLVTTLTDPAITSCAAVVDFGSPESFRQALERAQEAGIPFLSGTTGLTDDDRGLLASAAKRVPVFYSANMSIGVAIITEILPRLAELTRSMDVALTEMHHRHKKDAPSGTALKLSEVIAAARGVNDVAITSVRKGDVVGEHTITFFGDAERIELTHRAHSRDLFAAGAMRALGWLIEKRRPGLYTMNDLLRETLR